MGKKNAVPNRQYTADFKQEAVRLADLIGGNAAAKRLGVPQLTVTNGVRQTRAGKLQETSGTGAPLKQPVAEREAEVSLLRRELASTKLDLEIVKRGGSFRQPLILRFK